MKRECGEIAKLTYQSNAFGWKFTLDLSVFDMARELNYNWISCGFIKVNEQKQWSVVVKEPLIHKYKNNIHDA
jgi:hypothetical protein